MLLILKLESSSIGDNDYLDAEVEKFLDSVDAVADVPASQVFIQHLLLATSLDVSVNPASGMIYHE